MSDQAHRRPRGKAGTRPAEHGVRPGPFEAQYPNVARWVQDGYIEVGRDGMSRSFIRALDAGGMVWEGEQTYGSVDEAQALDAGIAEWLAENS
jgi:hypothetical protein